MGSSQRGNKTRSPTRQTSDRGAHCLQKHNPKKPVCRGWEIRFTSQAAVTSRAAVGSPPRSLEHVRRRRPAMAPAPPGSGPSSPETHIGNTPRGNSPLRNSDQPPSGLISQIQPETGPARFSPPPVWPPAFTGLRSPRHSERTGSGRTVGETSRDFRSEVSGGRAGGVGCVELPGDVVQPAVFLHEPVHFIGGIHLQ